MRWIDLEVIEGPDAGMSFTVEEGTYRVVGRAGDDGVSTIQMTLEGDRALDAQQEAVLRDLLRSRESRGLRTRFRKRGADILLHDGSVSRTHALVFVDADGVSVADLMSTNGTRVNGHLVEDADVCRSDRVKIGQSVLRLRLDA